MSAQLIDGKAIAESIKQKVADGVKKRTEQGLRAPGLAVILVGADPASEVYVRNKTNSCNQVGFKSETIKLPAETSQTELEELIEKFNQDDEIDGILLQLPLPEHLDSDPLLEQIRPDKDVDGFHPFNLGRLAQRLPLLRPCTPQRHRDTAGEHWTNHSRQRCGHRRRIQYSGSPNGALSFYSRAALSPQPIALQKTFLKRSRRLTLSSSQRENLV